MEEPYQYAYKEIGENIVTLYPDDISKEIDNKIKNESSNSSFEISFSPKCNECGECDGDCEITDFGKKCGDNITHQFKKVDGKWKIEPHPADSEDYMIQFEFLKMKKEEWFKTPNSLAHLEDETNNNYTKNLSPEVIRHLSIEMTGGAKSKHNDRGDYMEKYIKYKNKYMNLKKTSKY